MSETFVKHEGKHYNKILVPGAKKKKTISVRNVDLKGK